jgi:hypothetical protein
MRRSDFLQVLHRKPFRRFRLTVTTGQTFEVLHPETIFVAHRFASGAERHRSQGIESAGRLRLDRSRAHRSPSAVWSR